MRAPGGLATLRLAGRLAGPALAWLLLAGSAVGQDGGPAAPARRVPASPALAPIGVRTSSQPGFGRITFEPPAGADWLVLREDTRVVVRFNVANPVASGAGAPRNVRALIGSPGQAELLVAPGAQLRSTRQGSQMVLDVLDPAAPSAAPAPAHPPAHSPAREPTRPVDPAPVAPVVTPAPAMAAMPSPGVGREAPAAGEAPSAAGPLALAAVPAAPGDGVVLPFAPTTGAAAFRRGSEAMLVFDERRPIDIAALQADPLFGAAEIRLLPAATVLRLRLPDAMILRLARSDSGWTVMASRESSNARPIRPELDAAAEGARLRLPAGQPGRPVSVSDPLTGGTLLVGTQRTSGQGVAVLRQTPEFVLLPTWQGVAVIAASDAIALRDTKDGFVLASAEPTGGLALDPAEVDLAPLADAVALTRRFDFPAQTETSLWRRLQAATAAAAEAPAGARAAPRIAVAQNMIALGLGAEAQAVLALAASADPRVADDPELVGLSAIAALLAGRLDETAGIAVASLDGTDEVALWRALRTASLHEGSPEAAAVLATETRLLLAYPAPLRARLLPLAAETMALGGETAAAQALVDSRGDDATLDLARAILLTPHDRKAALVVLDRLAQSADRLVRARAAPRAIELRLSGGELTPSAAADEMDKLLYAWRGDAREVKLRLRTAELRAGAGAPRQALALLRETADAMPDQRDEVHARMETVFAAALGNDAVTPMPPLELVAMVEENPDLIAEGESGLALASRLASRLAELDLPRRSAPVLEKLVAAAAPGAVRAELGGRLAAARLQIGDPAGALAALAASGADELPPGVLEARTLTWARATSAAGDPARAAAALEGLGTPAAEALRVRLLEQAKDWKGATAVLRATVARDIPTEGPLSEAQAETLLQLASAAAQAGDEATLSEIRAGDAARLPQGRSADMLRLLVEGPVQTPDDLPRARREAAVAEGVVGKRAR